MFTSSKLVASSAAQHKYVSLLGQALALTLLFRFTTFDVSFTFMLFYFWGKVQAGDAQPVQSPSLGSNEGVNMQEEFNPQPHYPGVNRP